MKAFAGLLAVLVLLSCASLAQTAQATAAAGESSTPDAASQPSTSSSLPTTAAGPTEAAAASAADVPAAPLGTSFRPGAKLFLEPMDGFEPFLSEAIAKKKVPVVVVNDRSKADFVVSGGMHVKDPGWLKGWIANTHGKGGIAIRDAHTDNQVFACDFRKVNQMETKGGIYQDWANSCARHLKKAMEKK